MTLLMFFASCNGYVENNAFAAEGKVAALAPIEAYTETTTTKKKLGIIKVSETKTRSAVRSSYTINRNLPDDVFDKFSAGKPVDIEYLPEHPMTTARFVGHPSMPIESGLFGLLVALATYFFWKKK